MVARWFRTRLEHELWKWTSICIALLGIWWILVYVSVRQPVVSIVRPLFPTDDTRWSTQFVMWRLDPIPWWPFCVGGGLTVLSPVLSVPFVVCVAYLDRRDAQRRDHSRALEEGNRANLEHVLVMEARALAAAVPVDASSTSPAASDSATGNNIAKLEPASC